MAHEIIFNDVRGINPIAFVGETPWHGLGQRHFLESVSRKVATEEI